MVVQSYDPTRPRILRGGNLNPPDLPRGNHPEGIGERKMRIRVRIQQDDAKPIVAIRR